MATVGPDYSLVFSRPELPCVQGDHEKGLQGADAHPEESKEMDISREQVAV